MIGITYNPIGIIHSPFKETVGTPIQSSAANDITGIVDIYPDYAEGLRDLEEFSHIFLIYHLHLVKPGALLVKPFMDDKLHGVFATRSPGRPNSIGLSIVRLTKIAGSRLYIKDVDIVDGTPILDIKPYVPEIDVRETTSIGWFENNLKKLSVLTDDGRFCK